MDFKVQNNLRATCRTCVRVHDSRKQLISIFSEDQTMPAKKVKFSDMLASLTDFPVQENDALPQKICLICLQQIRSAFYFKLQAENSYRLFITHLGSSRQPGEVTIKQEDTNLHHLNDLQNESQAGNEDVPLILQPRSLNCDETFQDDLLLEMETSIYRAQSQPMLAQDDVELSDDQDATDYQDDDHEDHEIIDYEPDFTSNTPNLEALLTESSTPIKETSPDSGFTDKSRQSSSPPPSNFELLPPMESPEGADKFVCDICHKYQFSLKSLMRHKVKHHSENKCCYCKRKFPYKSRLRAHVRIKHPLKFDAFRLNGQVTAVVRISPVKEIPECDHCGVMLCDTQALLRHHANCDRKCIECSLVLPHKQSYFLHLSKEHNIHVEEVPVFECPFGCHGKFNSDKILQSHIENAHPDQNDDESLVETISESGDSVSNGSATLFPCPICDAVFKLRKNLATHTTMKHKEPAAATTKTRNVPKYTREEFIEKFFVPKNKDLTHCIACKLDFQKRGSSMHLKSKHVSIKCFRCEMCEEAFSRPDYRIRHMAMVHPTSLRCNKCKIQFDRAYKYDAHMSTHGVAAKHFKPKDGLDRYDLPTNNLKFIEDMATFDFSKCPIQRRMSIACSTSTSASVVRGDMPLTKDEFFERHFKTISDTKVKCTICLVELQKCSLQSHLLWKHAIKKPMKCAFCNERVVKANGRLGHMARCHPDEYKCNRCHQQFGKHALYAAHMQHSHQVEVTCFPSSGEERDLTMEEIRFVPHVKEDDVVDDTDVFLDPEVRDYLGLDFNSSVLDLNQSAKPKSMPKKVFDDNDTRVMTFEEFKDNFVEDVGPEDLKCLICERVMKKRNFGCHIKSRHAISGAYKCAVCPEAFFRPEHRIQHMAGSHRGMFFCQNCNIQFHRNSRYALHLRHVHDIEVDSRDDYEVDIGLSELMYTASIKKGQEEDETRMTIEPDINLQEFDNHEEAPSALPDNEAFLTRTAFMNKYFRTTSKDQRKCLPCDKIFPKGSLHSHLVKSHATVLPLKCPFCDLRLEYSSQRIRHMQFFHPHDYKCHECGLQFQKHSFFTTHMKVEHDKFETSKKSPFEEADIAQHDLKYVTHRDDWQEDASTTTESYSAESRKPSTSSASTEIFIKPKIKDEPQQAECIVQSSSEMFASDGRGWLTFSEFKAKYITSTNNDFNNANCVACKIRINRQYLGQHLRLRHANKDSFFCELCPQSFRSEAARNGHMNVAHPSSYKCAKCDMQFHYSVVFRNHLKNVHGVVSSLPTLKPSCNMEISLENLKFNSSPVAEEPKSTRATLKRRLSVAAPKVEVKPSKPLVVGMTFNDFKSRYIEDQDEKFFRCMACRKNILQVFLEGHLSRFHLIGKRFACEMCDDRFVSKGNRTRHMSFRHPNDYICQHCNVQFDLSSTYFDHMLVEHNEVVKNVKLRDEKKANLPMESMRFAVELTETGSDLVFNKPRNAFEDVPDDAELTREQFFGKFYRSLQKKHKFSGTGMTKCLACDVVFDSIKRAMHANASHATTRPFKCELCDSTFFLKKKRLKHMGSKHHADYRCSVCEVQFDRSSHYVDHMKMTHRTSVNLAIFNDDDIDTPVNKLKYLKRLTNKRKRTLDQTAAVAPEPAEYEEESLEDGIGRYFSTLSNQDLQCDQCHEVFDSSRALRFHARSHTNGSLQEGSSYNARETSMEKKVRVPVVPKISPQSFKLPTESEEQVHECNICQKRLPSSGAVVTHKKFSHTRTFGQSNIEFFCDICDFTCPRRDYLEHHVKADHCPEFYCEICNKHLSSYNYYLFHMHQHHPEAKNLDQNKFNCSDCSKSFRSEQRMIYHKNVKHQGNKEEESIGFCRYCGSCFADISGYKLHESLRNHKVIKLVVDARENKIPTTSRSPRKAKVKSEPKEAKSVVKTEVVEESDHDEDPIEEDLSSVELSPIYVDPLDVMMEQASLAVITEFRDEPDSFEETADESYEDVDDEAEMATDDQSFEGPEEEPSEENDGPSAKRIKLSFGEDKLDYLKYLQCIDNVYKCGICGKTKNVRKYMLHHLKQHDEVPTYRCNQCDEKFVFKKKYEKHLETHSGEDQIQLEVIDVDDHPKFQETKEDEKEETSEIKCTICDHSFRLKIMLNRHNTTWHAEDNHNKNLSVTEQKSKKDAEKHDANVITVFKCKHCSEAFTKATLLEQHLADKHKPAEDELEEEEEENGTDDGSISGLNCDKCSLSFREKKFLENHQKFFCAHRTRSDQAINEQ